MKVKVLSLMMLLILVISGCGGKEEKTLDISPATLAENILEQVNFEANLVPIAPEAVDNWYFLNDAVTEYAIYINGDVVPAEELAVLKCKSAEDVAQLEAILDQRLDNLKTSFENYQPMELTKINNPIRVTKGNVAVLVLTDDPNAQKTVEQLLK
ncbi:MAG: DUF4358 domain-containing protein [Oscillospiraceae bacterium]|jgi:sulfur carrier protein ThiS